MKIEIDTKHDSREELSALADMLHRLGGSSRSGGVTPRPEQKNIFDDPSPSGGLMNMFGGESSAPQSSTTGTQPSETMTSPSQDSPASGGLFSIFNSSGSGDEKPDPQSGSQPAGSTTVSDLLASGEPEPDKSAVQDILEDDRIVPY